MKLKLFQIDAFATRTFEGNPAAVCPLDAWLDDAVLQSIAEENNLSETAFFVPGDNGFDLRWFTPVAEVDLCGHATLASAHVLFHHLGYSKQAIHFQTRSGQLVVEKNGGLLRMNFPAIDSSPCEIPPLLVEGLGAVPSEVLSADDYLVVFPHEDIVQTLNPSRYLLSQLDRRGVIVTAKGNTVDFVSRFFAPKLGINEDPVTGSSHCQLTPYWSERLGKTKLQARQISKRGGSIACELKGERVLLSGQAVTFMVGEIHLE
jgi:predicted PhzF superfamily epimerase YddE/YHI9